VLLLSYGIRQTREGNARWQDEDDRAAPSSPPEQQREQDVLWSHVCFSYFDSVLYLVAEVTIERARR